MHGKEQITVVVVGGTPAGCAAAISAARMGAAVQLFEPTQTLGGMNASGQDAFDTGTIEAISGVAEEFGDRVRKYYREAGFEDSMIFHGKSDILWENHVANSIWRQMLAEFETIEVSFGCVPISVSVADKKIDSIDFERAIDAMGSLSEQPGTSEVISVGGDSFVDATYEGDIAAWAGIPFDLGREARSPKEPHAGKIFTTYMSRSPDDGYPPHTILPGSTGEGDDAIMAFNSRLCCRLYEDTSPDADHLLLEAPSGYDPLNYYFNREEFLPNNKPIFGTQIIPGANGKFHLNRQFKGNDLVGPNRDYILAHPRERNKYRKIFVNHALGFLFYIQNEAKCKDIGLADDEFIDNHNIPYYIYIRESRRIKGIERMDETFTNAYLTGDGPRVPIREDSIAIGDYPMDGKVCNDITEGARKYPDGVYFLRWIRNPYQIPFGAMVAEEVDNLCVTCALSVSHAAWTTVRLEGLWMGVGMAAGVTAVSSARDGISVSNVNCSDVQEKIVQMGAKLIYFKDVSSKDEGFAAIQWAGCKGYTPISRSYKFYPDKSLTWYDAIEGVFACFDLDYSVTGAHFVGVDPGHSLFRRIESVYDLGSRAGVDIFQGMSNPKHDPLLDANNPEPRTRWLEIDLDETLTWDELNSFIETVCQSLGLKYAPSSSSGGVPTRRDFVSAMHSATGGFSLTH